MYDLGISVEGWSAADAKAVPFLTEVSEAAPLVEAAPLAEAVVFSGRRFSSGASVVPVNSAYTGAACSQSLIPQNPGWRVIIFGANRRIRGAFKSSIITMSHTIPRASVIPKPLTDALAKKNSVNAETSVTKSASIEVSMP